MKTLGLLAATLLLLSACGGSSDDADAPTPTVTVTETTGSGPSESATAAADEPPTTYDEAVARIEAGSPEAGETVKFVTSGGTYCGLAVGSSYAGCELGGQGIEDPQVCAGAPSQLVGRIELQGGKAVPICNTDTVRTAAPELADGAVATTRDTQCISEAIGVTCVNRSGSGGFFLGTEKYLVF